MRIGLMGELLHAEKSADRMGGPRRICGEWHANLNMGGCGRYRDAGPDTKRGSDTEHRHPTQRARDPTPRALGLDTEPRPDTDSTESAGPRHRARERRQRVPRAGIKS